MKLPKSSIPGSVKPEDSSRGERVWRRDQQKTGAAGAVENGHQTSPIHEIGQVDNMDSNNNQKSDLPIDHCDSVGPDNKHSDFAVPDVDDQEFDHQNMHADVVTASEVGTVEIQISTATIGCQTDDISLIEAASQTNNSSKEQPTTKSAYSQTKAWTQPTLLEMLQFDRQLKVWTGLRADTFDILEAIIEEIERKRDISFTLPAFDRIVMVAMIIRHNLQYNMVGDFFGRCNTTISTYFRSTIVIMSEALHSLVYWPTQEENLASMPTYFVPFFTDTQIVLDCTECKISLMKCVNCRMATYSNYKSGNTVKVLIGVTPCGSINYVSRAYPGRVSDKYIFNKERVAERIDPSLGAVMTDKGFAIDKELDEKGIKLYRPPFLRGKKQFTEAECEETQRIAAARVHVERTIQRLKNYKLLASTIHPHFFGFLDHIFIVVAALVNLEAPILKDNRFDCDVIENN